MAADSRPVIIAALIGNSLIAITKFIASFMTGSSAMFSEGIHSAVDTGNQGLLLFGPMEAKKPADEDSPLATDIIPDAHGARIHSGQLERRVCR